MKILLTPRSDANLEQTLNAAIEISKRIEGEVFVLVADTEVPVRGTHIEQIEETWIIRHELRTLKPAPCMFPPAPPSESVPGAAHEVGQYTEFPLKDKHGAMWLFHIVPLVGNRYHLKRTPGLKGAWDSPSAEFYYGSLRAPAAVPQPLWGREHKHARIFTSLTDVQFAIEPLNYRSIHTDEDEG